MIQEQDSRERKRIAWQTRSVRLVVVLAGLAPMAVYGHGGGWQAFPTLHPLVVHFPIVLFPLAMLSHWIERWGQWTTSRFTFGLLILACVGAWLSLAVFHPHVAGNQPSEVLETLAEHERWADLAFYSGLLALVLKGFAHWQGLIPRLRNLLWWLTGVVLVISVVAVLWTGHEGAYLTHVLGVGPQGKGLILDNH